MRGEAELEGEKEGRRCAIFRLNRGSECKQEGIRERRKMKREWSVRDTERNNDCASRLQRG